MWSAAVPKHHDMKYEGRGEKAPSIFNLVTRQSLVVSFTLKLL
jgi:hypothetical protein